MKHLTIRNVPPKLAEAVQEARRRSGASLNQTVLDLLNQGLGVDHPRSNGLAAMAGDWSEEEFEEFQEAVAPFAQVDPELWS